MQIMSYAQEKKLKTPLYQDMKSKFGEDYDLMHSVDNNKDIHLSDVQSSIKKLRKKIGYKFQRIKHPLLEIEIKFEEWDSKNKKWILRKIIPGQSYAEVLSEHWYMCMFNRDVTMTDVGGTGRAVGSSQGIDTSASSWMNVFNNNAASATGSQSNIIGIVVGTGTTAFLLAQNSLITQVTTNWIHDANAAASFTPTLNGQTLSIEFDRLIRNTTGSQVTLEEVGIYVDTEWRNGFGTHGSFMLERTLTGGLVVNDLTTIRIRYTLKQVTQ